MNKILLVSTLMISMGAYAQGVPQKVPAKERNMDSFIEEALLPFKDMKIFHDRIMMYDAIKTIQEQQQNPLAAEEGTEAVRGVFDEKDSAVLESFMNARNVQYQMTDELKAKAYEQPFEAFKDLIKNAQIASFSKEDVNTLNTVDKKAISRMLQMITESGPDIGANQVPVMYNNETQN